MKLSKDARDLIERIRVRREARQEQEERRLARFANPSGDSRAKQ